MLSTMMHTSLGVNTLFRFGARHFANSRVADYDGEHLQWRSYKDVDSLAGRIASGLAALGVGNGDRVGTFLWNGVTHLGVYLAAPSMGAVLHTLNCRLAPDQIAYIINHANDCCVFVDGRLEAQFQPVLSQIPGVRHIIVCDPQGGLGR